MSACQCGEKVEPNDLARHLDSECRVEAEKQWQIVLGLHHFGESA